MLEFVFIVGLILGVLIGRAYEIMKFRYPESKEMILVKIEEQRNKRLKLQRENDKIKREINHALEREMLR